MIMPDIIAPETFSILCDFAIFQYLTLCPYRSLLFSSLYSLSLFHVLLNAQNSCPAGWIATEEGSCTDDNECISEPCNNGGTCINFDNGQGFLCMCPTGYMGDICHLPVQEKIILIANNTFWIIVVVIINVIGKMT